MAKADIYGHDISSDSKPVAEADSLLEFYSGVGTRKTATEIESNANSRPNDASASFDSEAGKREVGSSSGSDEDADQAGDESQQGH